MSAVAVPLRATRNRLAARPPWLGGLIGVVVVLVAWTVLSITVLNAGAGVPTPWAVLKQLHRDGWSFYRPHLEQTGSEAIKGYIGGNVAALAVAIAILLVPPIERVVMQLAVASYCLPIIAIGPILTVALNGSQPMAALAGLAVFFTTLVGALLGLRSADPTSLDLVAAYGGGRWQQMRRVRITAALPSTFAALQMAAPAALLGAIIGEYLGSVDRGLGVAMVISEQSLNSTRTWGIAIVSGAVAGIAYLLIGIVARLVTPWARATKGASS
jgi:ABC-type nitrate/sulfonate/bicarbonate transport system permease component